MRRIVAIGVLSAACGRDRDAPPPPSTSSPPAVPADAAVARVDPFADWDLKARAAGLEGAWVNVIGRPRIPVVIHEGRMTTHDLAEVTYEIGAITPCRFQLTVDGARDANLPSMGYAYRDGHLIMDFGTLGERRGDQTIVCMGEHVYVLDGSGTCTRWKEEGGWKSEPWGCRYKNDNQLDIDGHVDPLYLAGDVVHAWPWYPNVAIPARDYDDAKRIVAQVETDGDGLAAARALGGKRGDTSTIAGLMVTVAAAPKKWIGKEVTLEAYYFGSSYSDGSALVWSMLIAAPEHPWPMLTCEPLEPRGVAPYDRVVVTGTIEDASSLQHCRIQKK